MTNNLLLYKCTKIYKNITHPTFIIEILNLSSLNTSYRITQLNKASLPSSYLFIFFSPLYYFSILSMHSRMRHENFFNELFWTSSSSMMVQQTVTIILYSETHFGIFKTSFDILSVTIGYRQLIFMGKNINRWAITFVNFNIW